MEVGKKDRGPPPVDSGCVPRHRPQRHIRSGHRHDDHQRRGRQDTTRPTTVERQDRRATRCGALSKEYTGNHKTGDDKEDVYSNISTPETRNVRVIEDNQKNGDSTQALYVRTELAIPRSGTGFVFSRPDSMIGECLHLTASVGEKGLVHRPTSQTLRAR